MERKNIQWLSSHRTKDQLESLVKGLNHPVSLRVNRSGSNYTDKDDWFSCLEKMSAFEFTDICYEESDGKGIWTQRSLEYPVVINAFNPLQAERIFLWTMYCFHTGLPKASADGLHYSIAESRSFVRNLSYRLGRAWTKWDGCRAYNQKKGVGGSYSDCDPDSPIKWGGDRDLYEGMVVRCLAFQRSLIPEEEREWFSTRVNAAEMSPSECHPEWNAKRTGEFTWVPENRKK